MNNRPIETKNYRKPKQKKRIVSKSLFGITIAFRVLLACLIALAVFATLNTIFAPGFRYDVTAEGECTVTGYGFTTDTELIIPDTIDGYTVTAIGSSAFSGKKNFTRIVLPAAVAEIGLYAFSGCSSLTDIVIPEGVTTVEQSTFFECSSLTGITIPDSVTSIQRNAFSGCSSLTDIEIPAGVTYIGEYAFYDLSALTHLAIPASVAFIGEYALYDLSALTDITYGGTVAEWQALTAENRLFSYDSSHTVRCADGTVAADGTITYY